MHVDTPLCHRMHACMCVCLHMCTNHCAHACVCVSIVSSLRSERRRRPVEISRSSVRGSRWRMILQATWTGSHRPRTSTLTTRMRKMGSNTTVSPEHTHTQTLDNFSIQLEYGSDFFFKTYREVVGSEFSSAAGGRAQTKRGEVQQKKSQSQILFHRKQVYIDGVQAPSWHAKPHACTTASRVTKPTGLEKCLNDTQQLDTLRDDCSSQTR